MHIPPVLAGANLAQKNRGKILKAGPRDTSGNGVRMENMDIDAYPTIVSPALHTYVAPTLGLLALHDAGL